MSSDHGMASERYLNHPTFGMLYRVAPAGEGRDVYATLYAQRPRGAQFEVIPYGDARHHAEVHLGRCRRDGSDDLESWSQLFDQTFI